MNMTLQIQPKAISTPALVSPHNGLLQRKCSRCGNFSQDDEIKDELKKRLSLQRRSTDGTAAIPPIVHEVLNSPGQPLDTGIRALMKPLSGHDLRRLKIHADPKKPDMTEPNPLKSESVPGAHPYTAGAIMASGSVEGCKVKAGNYGSAKLMKFRIFDFNGSPVSENLTVGEKFTMIEDNYKVSSRLVPNSYNSEKGSFNDCYRFYQPEPLPDEFQAGGGAEPSPGK
jgi:hypothetical protein